MHQSCCHLDCIGDDDDEQQMPDSFAIVEHSHHAGSYTDWPLIGALLLTIVVCSILIYLLNWVIKRRQMTMGRELNQQRQTSSTDVDDDDDEVDNRRTRNAVDRIIRRESNRIIMV
jgi:type VI protein secretion system component VasK